MDSFDVVPREPVIDIDIEDDSPGTTTGLAADARRCMNQGLSRGTTSRNDAPRVASAVPTHATRVSAVVDSPGCGRHGDTADLRVAERRAWRTQR